MKITDLNVSEFEIYFAKENPYTAKHTINTISHSIIQVFTDEGITGVGRTRQISPSSAPLSPYGLRMNENLKRLIIGQDPFEYLRLWDNMFSMNGVGLKGRREGGSRGIMAYGGVDTAIWDIMGKATKKPVHKLLGGYNDSLPVYGSGGYVSASKEDLVKEMERYAEAGFKGVLMKVGKERFDEDLERIAAVRDAIGHDVKLMVDASASWDVKTAISHARKMEKYDIFWLQSPCHEVYNDHRSLAMVANAIDIHVCAGNEYSRYGIHDMLERNAVDIIKINHARIGGITEGMRVAHLASVYNKWITGHYAVDVNSQVISAFPNGLILEYLPLDANFLPEIFVDPPEPEKGILKVSKDPGLGLELKEELLDEKGRLKYKLKKYKGEMIQGELKVSPLE